MAWFASNVRTLSFLQAIQEIMFHLESKAVVPMAIIGLLREGKSTLLNLLLKRWKVPNVIFEAFKTSSSVQSCTRGMHVFAFAGELLSAHSGLKGKTVLLLDFEGLGEARPSRSGGATPGMYDTRLFALAVTSRPFPRSMLPAPHSAPCEACLSPSRFRLDMRSSTGARCGSTGADFEAGSLQHEGWLD